MYHDIGYKSDVEIPIEYQRNMTRLAGMLELADEQFSHIRKEINGYRRTVQSMVANGNFNEVPLNGDTFRSFLKLRPFKKLADKIAAINEVNRLGSEYGIGRDMHIGDTIIGIKGRVGFEAAGAILIINAHKMLEKHTLTKWQQYWKDQIGTWYGMFLHEAQYLEPVMRDMEAMLESSQRNVTGRVIINLRPYSYTLVGVETSYDLMRSDFGEYGEVVKAWTADDVKGFTKILGNQMKIYHNVQKRNGKE
jgi:hypothetical protein